MSKYLKILSDKNMLFLEDDMQMAKHISDLLGMFVENLFHATSIQEATELYNSKKIDIIISDIKLKKDNGLDFIKSIRKIDDKIPIMIISGHKDEEFLLKSIPLNLTAYLLKPIKYEELLNALSLCGERLAMINIKSIHLKDNIYFDTDTKILSSDGIAIELTKKELLFIELLINNKNKLLTKELIWQYVYSDDDASDSAITNMIMRLRKKLGKNFIYTIPDVGYRLIP